MEREVPEQVYVECPNCDDMTAHDVLKGKIGKMTLEATLRCEECGRVSTRTLPIPRIVKTGVIISDGAVSERTQTELEAGEKISVGDEFFLEDGRRLRVCSLDMGEGRRQETALSQDVKMIWAQQFDHLHMKVTINDDRKSFSRRLDAEPDDEFVIGQVLSLEDMDCYVHAIKTRESLVSRGSAQARDIVRIYGKRKTKSFPILDLEDGSQDI
jgi:uncharacterized Zn finger protein